MSSWTHSCLLDILGKFDLVLAWLKIKTLFVTLSVTQTDTTHGGIVLRVINKNTKEAPIWKKRHKMRCINPALEARIATLAERLTWYHTVH